MAEGLNPLGSGGVGDAEGDCPAAHGQPDTVGSACADEPRVEGQIFAGEGLADKKLGKGSSGRAAAFQDGRDDLLGASMDLADGGGSGTGVSLAAAWNVCGAAISADSRGAAAGSAWHADREAGSLPRGLVPRCRSSGGRSPPALDLTQDAGHARPGRSPQAPCCRHAMPPAAAAASPAAAGAQGMSASKAGAPPPWPHSAGHAAVSSFTGSGTAGRLPLAPCSADDANAGQGRGETGDLSAAHMHARQRSSRKPDGAVGLVAPSRRTGARCFDLGV